ncbi:MAG: DNA-binding protein [Bdellovibrionaceae bacterium]|nr:DNA-binding protein [Pseudobdellovibrionaceae bacterium]NUM57166.1 DUF296 domain-containing protein [Pseudobdellovibrionaceae bacterium]
MDENNKNYFYTQLADFYFLKLSPNDDLRTNLEKFCTAQNITSGGIISSVGSLSQVNLRKANSNSFYEQKTPHEVLSLSGLISNQGIHVHAMVANKEAQVFGGHLCQGNLVFTTIELVIAVFPEIHFLREFDSSTGYKELLFKKLR